jgi:hypothetical protein
MRRDYMIEWLLCQNIVHLGVFVDRPEVLQREVLPVHLRVGLLRYVVVPVAVRIVGVCFIRFNDHRGRQQGLRDDVVGYGLAWLTII